MMDAQQHAEEQQMIQEREPLTLADRKVQLKVFAGTVLASGGIDLLLHGGWPGLAAGAAAALLISGHNGTPDVYRSLQSALPWAELQEVLNRHEPGERSIADRLMGRHPDYVEEDEYDSRDPEPLVPILPQPDAPVVTDVLPENATEHLFSVFPHNKTLFLGREVATGRRVDPPMNGVLGRGVLLAGQQGMGKSNIIGLIVQAAGACGPTLETGMPVLVIDFKGEFYPLLHVVPNGLLAVHPGEVNGRADCFGLTKERSPLLAKQIMEGPRQVVLDVPSWGGDYDEVAQVMATLMHAMMDWSRDRLRAGKRPWPCLVITDEAHNFTPERRSLSGCVMLKPEESFRVLTSAYSRMANAGRSFGYTLVMATQRLPNIAKWSIANLQVKVIMGHSLKNDLDACEEETEGAVERETIKKLTPGQGIVVGLGVAPLLVAFDEQRAEHISTTPNLEELHAHFSDKQQVSERPKQERSYTPPSAPNAPEMTAILHLLERGAITVEDMLAMVNRLPVTQPDEEITSAAPYPTYAPVQKLVLPGAQPASHSAPTTRTAPQRPVEQHAHYPGSWVQHVPSGQRGHLQAVPRMEDLPVQQVEEQKYEAPKFSTGLSPELQETYEAWHPGIHNRDLGDALRIDQATAGRRVNRLIEKGAISRDKRQKLFG